MTGPDFHQTEQIDPGLSRRRFIRLLLGFSLISTLAMVATPMIGFLFPTRTASSGGGGRVLAATTDDVPIGSGKVSRWATSRS